MDGDLLTDYEEFVNEVTSYASKNPKNFIDEFNLEENKIHDFVSSAVQNYPLYDNFKAGNHSIVLEYLKKNFKRLNN